ncbi:MAG: hypothetical protein H6751_15000, partial [Candidatus Omnitrophica bacterium]|nr:hypothetical protein [Candidatus Omnitrophota bacterium]
VDRDTGLPKTPMALWNDARAFPHFHRISESKPPSYWRQFSLRDEPGMGLARIEWLRERSPELIQDQNLYVGIGEWVYHRLTGQWKQDACNALQIGCYDVHSRELTDKPLKARGIYTSFFAPMRKSHESSPLTKTAAAELGLPEGIPVLGPYNDHEAGYLSVAQVSKNPLECSLGTAWVGNFQLPLESPGRSPFQLAIPSPLGKGRLIIQPLLTGNVTWDWALEIFVHANHRKALDLQAKVFEKSLLPPEGLIGLPWVNRPNPFSPDINGAGCLIGTNPSTSKEDLLRAVAAGMCYELARVFNQVKEEKKVDSVVLCGGASRGRVFQQMTAALFSPLPVYRILDEDAMGTRGCLFPFSEKVAKLRTERIKVSPQLDIGPLNRGRGLYQEAFDRMYAHVPAGRAYAI